ncbi:GrpB family protein [Solibacillus sp. FSL K6-1523]|uniref:GrpB family protein n=1 Tax=Solibacillus sp. FSL K6-1523 TaxID=2921471 RepID=UPI0030F6AD55
MGKTEVIAWTEEWKNLYNLEEVILKEVLKEELLDIFHIGSTSIRTIGYAKPIIDMLIVVTNINQVDFYINEMVAMGYEPKGENGIAGRRYFTKGKESRTHHLHIYQIGNEHINNHIYFKEYLLNNHSEAKKYGDLKLSLAKQFPNEHLKYQEGKQQFINELVSKAKKWGMQNRNFCER